MLDLSFNLSAYLRVFRVWSLALVPGHTQASMIIFTLSLPMKESLKTMVSLDCLKGMCTPWEAYVFYWSIALKHSFKASKDLLISAPSCCLSLLLLWVSWALSLPAKSTKSNLPGVFIPSSWTFTLQIAWLLLEVSLALVAWVVLTLFPKLMRSRSSCSDWTNCSLSPWICTFCYLSSISLNCSWLFNKS